MNPARLWPLAIVAVLALTVVGNALLLYYAAAPGAAVVEPDYYGKALAWDSTLARRAEQAALGWRIEAELGARGPEGTPLVVRLRDAAGAPIAGATVTIEAIHNAPGARHPRAALRPVAGGGYGAPLPLDRRGLWELRIEASRGRDRFSATLRREAAP
jgi:nitrogen fixation protein FixH